MIHENDRLMQDRLVAVSEREDRWDRRFVGLALHVAGWSKDRSTRVGAVVVGPDLEVRSVGFNGFPRGVDDDVEARHERPSKYLWTSHAEENAIVHSSRFGVQLTGCTMYVTHHPCAGCARAIVQAGIRRVVVSSDDDLGGRFADQMAVARQMFREAGVSLRVVR